MCKQGKAALINDIAREEMGVPKILVGIFISPFSVHYNGPPSPQPFPTRSSTRRRARNVHMGSMHWRCLLRRLPIYARSPHITQNNRAVTRFQGSFRDQEISCYVVQIGGGSVHGIDVFRPGGPARGEGGDLRNDPRRVSGGPRSCPTSQAWT